MNTWNKEMKKEQQEKESDMNGNQQMKGNSKDMKGINKDERTLKGNRGN